MESSKKIAHSREELIGKFRQMNIDEKYYPRFLAYYDKIFSDLTEDYKDWSYEDFDEGDSVKKSTWDLVKEYYITRFMKYVSIGHSEELAHLVGDSSENIDEHAFDVAYSTMKDDNPELAEKELLLRARNISTDEHFIRYYLYLFECQSGWDSPIQKAKDYAKYYNEQMALGKSVVFAHEYADLMAWGKYRESYCDAYAYALDKALQEGRDESYSHRYAELFSEEVGENYSRLSDALSDRDYNFWHERIIGNMTGWEYACEHKLAQMSVFIKCYEHEHINIYYPSLPENREETDKRVLNRALESYRRRVEKK